MTWRPLRFLFVLLALFGLIGQTAVYAMAPLATPAGAAIEIAAPSDGCAGMNMAGGEDVPCKGITLDCIAKMGCMVPPALATAAGLASHAVTYEPVTYLVPDAIFAGLTVSPEVFPPIA